MSIFKRKQPVEEVRHSHEVPISTIFRWYLYDTDLGEDPSALAESVGLSRISEEGEAKEREDSDLRLEAVVPLLPFLDMIATISADAMAGYRASTFPEVEESEEDINMRKTFYKAIASSSLVGAMSIGLDLGVIETSTVITALEKKELPYE
ncbi:hypothetical protein UFOVP965_56 [uncultured Caudovirales phage]|uniref:Uncharacterized protein n=1 Tax=uncultured Caudovirales phage TaxID=2100421 RepID=A0A6J5Q8I7_9CAUD|nr:hypothetical protein UFOVP965_56 [uncultured Caudovirales phage]CAB4179792.1 hypothetical protein UFOVP1035_52 [uncultured Caudovirales phage]CAB4188331.1 hypothetical protein UFOVP1181_11 [uncultured Caudovirales phage]